MTSGNQTNQPWLFEPPGWLVEGLEPSKSQCGESGAAAGGRRRLRLLPPLRRLTGRRVPLVLASASPARHAVLRAAGVAFLVDPASIDEPSIAARLGAATPDLLVRELASWKARAVAARHPTSLVLGADTVVVDGAQVIGKPRDATHAREILTRLAGRRHVVFTGLVLIDGPGGGRELAKIVRSEVEFRALPIELITRYISTGEPFGKAGAYAVQGRGAALVRHIEGEYNNVLGLPILHLIDAMEEIGYGLL